jgi:hypothetical protein
MIDPNISAFFFDELTKEALSGKHLGGAALVGGGVIAGAVGKDALQDRKEGRVIRAQREMQQRQMMQAMKRRKSGASQGGY